jgi:hypothetical protein
LCTNGKTYQSITHPEIAPSQACLTPEFIAVGLPEKKVYIGGTSILSILISLEPGCDNKRMKAGEKPAGRQEMQTRIMKAPESKIQHKHVYEGTQHSVGKTKINAIIAQIQNIRRLFC